MAQASACISLVARFLLFVSCICNYRVENYTQFMFTLDDKYSYLADDA